MSDKPKKQITLSNLQMLAKLLTRDFTTRMIQTVSQLNTIKPGMDAFAIKESLKHIRHLLGGGFVVIAGQPGNGKTTAAIILALQYFAHTQFVNRQSELLDNHEILKEDGKIDGDFDVFKIFQYCQNNPDTSIRRHFIFQPTCNIQFHSSHEILSEELNQKEYDDIIYETYDLLILDDFGAEFSSKGDWTSAVWDKVINYRYANQLPTIITTNLSKTELAMKYNERIVDRLNECAKFVIVKEPSFRSVK